MPVSDPPSEPPARQLPLPFVHQPDYTAPFTAARSNAEILAWLKRTPDWPSCRLALWGEEGCGKTHLLHLWAADTDALVLDSEPLPCGPLRQGFAVDNAEAFLRDQARFLHFLNGAAEAGQPVLLASRLPPARWPVSLPDLRSRLRATMAVEVRPAEEELLASLLARLLADRQLSASKSLRSWLLTHLPRTPAAIREAVAHLDALSLAARGAVTRNLAREVVSRLTSGS